MRAEALIIGDELLRGETRDRNGPALGAFLEERGFAQQKVSLLADDPQEIGEALENAWRRSDLVICSGGLGPTKDDITKKALVDFFQAPLERSAGAETLAREHYRRRGRDWDPRENHYGLLPQGFQAVANPRGLAPGLALIQNRKLLLAGPGVPGEFAAMLKEEFAPLLTKTFGHRPPRQKITIRTRGVAEEDIFKKLCPDLWERLSSFGQTASLPYPGGVDILVKLAPPSEAKHVRALLEGSPLAPYIWHFGEMSLPEVLIQTAREKKLTLALAESCTGGLASSRLTDVAGASEVFAGGAVAYQSKVKENLLRVPPGTSPISEEMARHMAAGAREKMKVHLALALTGVAGPGECDGQAPGTLAIAIQGADFTHSELVHFPGTESRGSLKERFARHGLFALLDAIRVCT